jgi:hypothetical protein
LWLSAYAPQRNLIERWWWHRKDKRSCHRWWQRHRSPQTGHYQAVAGLEAQFHATDGPAFRPVQNFCESA